MMVKPEPPSHVDVREIGSSADDGFDGIPTVRRPHVAGRVDSQIGDQLDVAALELVKDCCSDAGSMHLKCGWG